MIALEKTLITIPALLGSPIIFQAPNIPSLIVVKPWPLIPQSCLLLLHRGRGDSRRHNSS